MHLKQITLLACFALGAGTANAVRLDPSHPYSPNSPKNKNLRGQTGWSQRKQETPKGRADRKKGRLGATFKPHDNRRKTG